MIKNKVPYVMKLQFNILWFINFRNTIMSWIKHLQSAHILLFISCSWNLYKLDFFLHNSCRIESIHETFGMLLGNVILILKLILKHI